MKRRSRIVSFRLSDEEYNSLKNVTESRGARSVSEFTRKVACNLETAKDGEAIEETLRSLNANMVALAQKVDVLLEEKNATDSTDFTDFKNIKNKERVE